MQQIKERTIKRLARDAKARIKGGYWNKFQDNLNNSIINAENCGLDASRVKSYFLTEATRQIRGEVGDDDLFYNKVKEMLDRQGDVSDAIGRLTDVDYFNSLDFDGRQRYILNISQRYLCARERYKAEKYLNQVIGTVEKLK